MGRLFLNDVVDTLCRYSSNPSQSIDRHPLPFLLLSTNCDQRSRKPPRCLIRPKHLVHLPSLVSTERRSCGRDILTFFLFTHFLFSFPCLVVGHTRSSWYFSTGKYRTKFFTVQLLSDRRGTASGNHEGARYRCLRHYMWANEGFERLIWGTVPYHTHMQLNTQQLLYVGLFNVSTLLYLPESCAGLPSLRDIHAVAPLTYFVLCAPVVMTAIFFVRRRLIARIATVVIPEQSFNEMTKINKRSKNLTYAMLTIFDMNALKNSQNSFFRRFGLSI